MVQACRRCGQVHDVYASCAAAAAAIEGDALVGSVLADRYRVGAELGRGIAGTVYGVQHQSFARAAALKVLRPQHAPAELVSRVFHGEARAAWSVSHPSLVEVFDIGALPDGAPFYVTEYLEGETLAARIARERISLGAAVDVVMQLLAALATIHGRDLLLRDLRPHNVFLAQRRGCRPLVKILDFGLARLTPIEAVQRDWEARRTNKSSAAIPYYLSPERTHSEHGIEPASDLFVLGTIFYEMLAGERPFASTTWSVLVEQIRAGHAAPLEAHRSDVSPELDAFVGRVLSPHPRGRPTSAKEMQDELRAIFEGGRRGPSHAAPPPSKAQEEPSTFTSMAPSTAAPPVRPLDPMALRPLDAPHPALPATRLPSVSVPLPHLPPRLAGLEDPDAYGDETETRQGILRLPSDRPGSLPPPAPPPPARLAPEAAPPPAVPAPRPSQESIKVVFDDARSSVGLGDTGERTVERASPDVAILALLSVTEGEEREEQTETMALTPELKEEVERLMALSPPSRPTTNAAAKSGLVAPPPVPPRRPRPSGR